MEGSLALLIPIIALSIPVVAIAMNGLVKIARIRATGSGEGAAGGGELQGRLDALEQEVDILRHELTETQERLDFAERMLAQGDRSRQLPEG
jgi:hypothetical protein